MTPGNGDRDPRIRHLPPDGTGRAGAPTPPSRRPSPRTAAVVGGAITFTLILVVFGLGGRQAVESTTTSTVPGLIGEGPVDFTTTTLLRPETLADRLGNEVESVRLATIDDEGSSVLLWHTDSIVPRHYPISTEYPTPRFDVSGKFIAYLDWDQAALSPRGAIYIQQTGHHLETPLVEGGRGFAWHPTDEARFAFAITGTSGTDIVTGRAGPLASDADIAVSVPGDATLVAWGDWGYAVAFDESSAIGGGVPGVLVVDPEGVPTHAVAGRLRTASGSSFLVEGPGADSAPIWTAALQAAAPAPAIAPTPDSIDLLDETLTSRGVFSGESGERIAAVIDHSGNRLAVWDTASALTVSIIDLTAQVPRVLAFNEAVRPVSFVRGGNALALQSEATGELLIVDTRTGATVRLPIDLGVTVRDAWL